ncbi:MAG: polymer-forming cytoskeletal protein [Bacteroidales bacterium]|nr:polymer-forming cytoskeletal protein [Bacteroidales bacterium]
MQSNEKQQKAIITKDMVITGSVEVITDMEIHGVVHGNVTSQGNLLITGIVEGDIVTKGATIVASKMQANISANDYIDIHEDCEITGDLSANNISVNGSVKGNLNASGHIALKEKSMVLGDLQTGSLEIRKGAVINGKIAFTPTN